MNQGKLIFAQVMEHLPLVPRSEWEWEVAPHPGQHRDRLSLMREVVYESFAAFGAEEGVPAEDQLCFGEESRAIIQMPMESP